MSSHDDDILDFDFFEDDPTREQQGGSRGGPARKSGGGGGRRRPSLRAPHGITPLLRLIGFVALAILVVLLLVLWVQGCSSDKKHNDYADAMTELGTVGSSSAKIGSSLAELLTTPGLKQAELETSLGGLIQREQQDVDNATGIDVPGPLRPSTDHAMEALQLRVAGMQGLLDTFVATKDDDSKNATAAGEKLAERARLLDASDVVWQELFRCRRSRPCRTKGSPTSRRPRPSSSRTSSSTRRAR